MKKKLLFRGLKWKVFSLLNFAICNFPLFAKCYISCIKSDLLNIFFNFFFNSLYFKQIQNKLRVGSSAPQFALSIILQQWKFSRKKIHIWHHLCIYIQNKVPAQEGRNFSPLTPGKYRYEDLRVFKELSSCGALTFKQNGWSLYLKHWCIFVMLSF